MTNVLIIKVGALGDVVRTTPLLRVLEGNITWVTAARAVPLLEGNPYIDRIRRIEAGPERLLGDKYDLVINLEDEPAAAKLASISKRQPSSARTWASAELLIRNPQARGSI